MKSKLPVLLGCICVLAAASLGADAAVAPAGVKLQQHLRTFGVPCELVYPGAPAVQHQQIADYVIARLAPK